MQSCVVAVDTATNCAADIAALSSMTSWSDDVASCGPYDLEGSRHARDNNKDTTSVTDGKSGSWGREQE
jgi:hypothetical protein